MLQSCSLPPGFGKNDSIMAAAMHSKVLCVRCVASRIPLMKSLLRQYNDTLQVLPAGMTVNDLWTLSPPFRGLF